jgi:ribonuclease P protein component
VLSRAALAERRRVAKAPWIRRLNRCKNLINKDETYLSAQQSAAQADPRIPRPDGDAQRAPRAQTASHQGTPSPDRLDPAQAARVESGGGLRFGTESRLHRRTDFLNVRRLGIRAQTAHFVVYLAQLPNQTTARLGLAVSRQVGNAVVRNRIKRRLRESFRCALRPVAGPDGTIVVIARQGAAELKTPEVTAELKAVISRMARKATASPRP